MGHENPWGALLVGPPDPYKGVAFGHYLGAPQGPLIPRA